MYHEPKVEREKVREASFALRSPEVRIISVLFM
jgi:hypothetical protein